MRTQKTYQLFSLKKLFFSLNFDGITKSIAFDNYGTDRGFYSTENKKEQDALEKTTMYGSDYFLKETKYLEEKSVKMPKSIFIDINGNETNEIVDETNEIVDETNEIVDETNEIVDETNEIVDEKTKEDNSLLSSVKDGQKARKTLMKLFPENKSEIINLKNKSEIINFSTEHNIFFPNWA